MVNHTGTIVFCLVHACLIILVRLLFVYFGPLRARIVPESSRFFWRVEAQLKTESLDIKHTDTFSLPSALNKEGMFNEGEVLLLKTSSIHPSCTYFVNFSSRKKLAALAIISIGRSIHLETPNSDLEINA